MMPEKNINRSFIRKYAPLLGIVGLMVALYATGAHQYVSIEVLAENRGALIEWIDANVLIGALAYVALYAILTAASLPAGAVLTMSGGFLFGAWLGGLYTVLGATIGATAIFMVARTSLGDTLTARAGPFLEKLRDGFQDGAVSYMLFLRLVPVFPFWLINLAPALLGVPLITYVWTTALGIIPGTFAFAIFGSGLGSVIDAQQHVRETCIAAKSIAQCPYTIDYGSILTPQLIMGLTALGVVSLVPVLVKKFKDRRTNKA